MNLINLQKAQDLIKKIPAGQFDMSRYRSSSKDSQFHQCESVGCIIGWCTILDTPANVEEFRTMQYIDENGDVIKYINFTGWSEKFFGLSAFSFVNADESNIYDWLFSSVWSRFPETNTVDHAVYRIQRILDGYRPNLFAFSDEIKRLNLEI